MPLKALNSHSTTGAWWGTAHAGTPHSWVKGQGSCLCVCVCVRVLVRVRVSACACDRTGANFYLGTFSLTGPVCLSKFKARWWFLYSSKQLLPWRERETARATEKERGSQSCQTCKCPWFVVNLFRNKKLIFDSFFNANGSSSRKRAQFSRWYLGLACLSDCDWRFPSGV